MKSHNGESELILVTMTLTLDLKLKGEKNKENDSHSEIYCEFELRQEKQYCPIWHEE